MRAVKIVAAALLFAAVAAVTPASAADLPDNREMREHILSSSAIREHIL